MRKIKKTPPPAPPATDHPTGKKKGFPPRSLFTLVDDPPSLHQHQRLFDSYDLETLKQELARIEAKEKLENNNYIGQTIPLREQIKTLELLSGPIGSLNRLKGDFEQADAYQSELIYLLAKHGDEVAFESFNRKIEAYVWCLKRMASDGHEGALRSLATLAIEATELVNQHAKKSPEAFIPVASGRSHWPFLKSLHKQINLIKEEDEDAFLMRLKLGKKTQQDLAPANRYDLAKPASAIAQKLLDYVRDVHQLSQFTYRGKPPSNPQPSEYLVQAGRLPDAGRDQIAADEWWKLAKAFLLESYPALDPESGADLSEIAPTLLSISQVTEPQRRRIRIMYNLERAFKTILAKPPGTRRISF